MFYSQEIEMKQSMDNVCPKCEMRFHKWGDYHTHVTTVKCSKIIRPLKTSGRSKEEIVMNAEKTWLKAGIIALGLFLIGPRHAFANCGNDNGNGNGCSNNQGPTGPQGPAGQNGSNGTNGTNGANGQNGKDGKDGKDTSASFRGTDLALDAAVRLIDTKYMQLQAFDTYVFGSTPGSDIFGDGHNQTIGARIVIKLGKSYEERKLDELKSELDGLKAQLRRK